MSDARFAWKRDRLHRCPIDGLERSICDPHMKFIVAPMSSGVSIPLGNVSTFCPRGSCPRPGAVMPRLWIALAFAFAFLQSQPHSTTSHRSTAAILYQATPRDPTALAGALLAMILWGLLATWIPAQRAASEPTIAAARRVTKSGAITEPQRLSVRRFLVDQRESAAHARIPS